MVPGRKAKAVFSHRIMYVTLFLCSAQLEVVMSKQEELRDAYKGVEAEPNRVAKQVEVVIKAKQNMADDLQKLQDKYAQIYMYI
jgi:hypothetical protein